MSIVVINGCSEKNVKPGDTSTFIKFFGGPYENEAYDVNTLADGYIIAGRVQNINAAGAGSDYDFQVIRTDQFGNKKWEVTLGDSLDDVAKSVIQTSDGGFVAVGSYTNSPTESKMFVVKMDDNGSVIWSRLIGSVYQIYGGNDIIEMYTGEFMTAGYSQSTSSTEKNLQFFKLDASGLEISAQDYGNDGTYDEAFQVYEKLSADGTFYEYIVAAALSSTAAGVPVVTGGAQVGSIIILGENLGVNDGIGIGSSSGETFGYAVINTNQNDYYLVGTSNALSPNFGGNDAFLAKFVRVGAGLTDSAWAVKYGVAGEDVAHDIIFKDNNFIIGGYRGSESMLIKANLQGQTKLVDCNSSQTDITEDDFCHLNASRSTDDDNLWFRTFGSVTQQMEGKINSVTSAIDDGFIMAGSSRFANTTMMSLTKTNSKGQVGE